LFGHGRLLPKTIVAGGESPQACESKETGISS
jgi:hypothetical protein